jgi:hypothetical protein
MMRRKAITALSMMGYIRCTDVDESVVKAVDTAKICF